MNILMVCLGNICRSPMAHGILDKMIQDSKLDWQVDSAGTSGWHAGELPDSRSISTAKKNGLDITYQRSRIFTQSDFDKFDLILAMDSSNYQDILRLARNDADKQKVELLLNYSHPGQNRAVPDPYYEGGFDKVYAMIQEACEKLMESLTSKS